MHILIENIGFFLQSALLLFFIEFISSLLKFYILVVLGVKAFRLSRIPKPLIFLMGILIGGFVVDFAWLIKLTREIFFPDIDYKLVVFFIRIAWAFNLIQFQFLGLLIESLGEKNYKIRAHQFFLLILNFACIAYFIGLAFFHYHYALHQQRSWLEFKMMAVTSVHMLLILLVPSLYFTFKNLRDFQFPKILKKQLTILMKYLIGAYIAAELIQGLFVASISNSYAITTLSTAVLAFAIYYTTRTIMGLRFLNFHNHVQSTHKFNFIDDFKNLLEKLSRVTTMQELGHITEIFFKDAFDIMPSRNFLYFRKLNAHVTCDDDLHEMSNVEKIVENFMNRHNERYIKLQHMFSQQKIFIYDEIAFSNFYEENELNKEILNFLDSINADIFLPVYDHQSLIAYIIIERNARLNRFYSNIERDEMLVFASYLGNIINLLQNRNLTRLIQKEKEMRDELYQKHNEIAQYKESIRSFMRDNKQRKIGILFYKNGRFEIGNKDARDLIDININAFVGHPITKSLKQLVVQVKEYKLSQTSYVRDSQGNKLVLSAIPNLEHNNVIITVYYPEISDIIKQQVDYLENPSEWDYLLYLETTKSGQLINQLIPGLGEHLLAFKIELLKMALSKKPLLLDLPEDDLRPTVEILHHISLREQLHVLKLQGPVTDAQIAVTLFGINPIFGENKNQPLFEQLNNIGTLFISNIHFLDMDSQNYLAEYIKYGFYHVYKSDRRVMSNVRIICSTNQNLHNLVQEGKFSRQLFDELKQVTLRMPSMLVLSDAEVDELVQGFSEQAISSPLFKNFLELSSKEKQKLIHSRPVSLQEFKEKVHQLLVQKSKKANIYQETEFDPAYNVADPELSEAARLGKKALRDQKMMAILWNKFKNQNKIAVFLGVDRSSVSRRCKDYNLI